MLGGCQKQAAHNSAVQEPVKVFLLVDEVGVNDSSFNQAALQGLEKAKKELGVQTRVKVCQSSAEYTADLEALVKEQPDLIIAVGFQMQNPVATVAQKYPECRFAIIDSVVDLPNVQSLSFQDEEGAFLMGIIAGKTTRTNKIGFIGGQDIPLIKRFEAGFAAGVKAVNPRAAEGLINRDGKSPGDQVKFCGNFQDSDKGYEIAQAMYGSGCDIIYHAAGGAGLGLFKAAREISDRGQKVWALGTDMDQAQTTPYGAYILSSSVKGVDTAAYKASQEMVRKRFQAGLVVLGLKDQGISLAPSTNKNTPAEVIELADRYAGLIKSGKLIVPSNRAAAVNFIPPQVK